ncbi:MFS transporter [Ramlibacter rhizophilus]|uniref:MFS transporter n=1 Tax=Ramlibacter rhizophilus TaxID=1781167 RepID=A0A4Z0BRR8_9BURK|nr:MFS transporter [Ramlibacter rhizophilus]TFZ01521.1 MFS transporter [Ramlibacter rhizophilus]
MGSSVPTPTRSDQASAWTMLLAFTAVFAMSQAFRTLPAIVAPPLVSEFGLTPGQLGVFAGAFHFAFGGLQFVMGVGMDMFGPRRTVLWVFPLAIAGALIAAAAPGYGALLIGQVLIGTGCAPAFVACTLFIATRFEPARFASMSGAILGLGSVGLLVTGTPLAWLIEASSWRAAFIALAAASALAWLAVWRIVKDPPGAGAGARMSLGTALRGYGELFRLPHTWGIVALGLVTYASFMALRGLWLGPLLVDRHGFSLVASGHVALAVSVVGMLGPPLFGRIDPGTGTRRRWLVGYSLLIALGFFVMAATHNPGVDVGLAVVMSLVSGYMVLQYADVKSAYPAAMTGRAMAIFTMAMFLGVALVQWLTGRVASVAAARGAEPYAWILASIGLMLVAGALAFRWLPAPGRPGERA